MTLLSDNLRHALNRKFFAAFFLFIDFFFARKHVSVAVLENFHLSLKIKSYEKENLEVIQKILKEILTFFVCGHSKRQMFKIEDHCPFVYVFIKLEKIKKSKKSRSSKVKEIYTHTYIYICTMHVYFIHITHLLIITVLSRIRDI